MQCFGDQMPYFLLRAVIEMGLFSSIFLQIVGEHRNPITVLRSYCEASSFQRKEKVGYGTDPLPTVTVYEYVDSIRSCENITVDAGTCFVEKGAPWTLRCLPTFVIIGTMKSATGALMRYLNLHPALISGKRILPHGKLRNEVHYFDQCSAENRCNWIDYMHFFPRQNIEDLPSIKMTFEKTPSYIISRRCLDSMYQMLPSLRLIVVLRDPIDRALSAFCHHCRHHRYISFYKNGRKFLANSL